MMATLCLVQETPPPQKKKKKVTYLERLIKSYQSSVQNQIIDLFLFYSNYNKMNTFQQLHSYELGIVSLFKQYNQFVLYSYNELCIILSRSSLLLRTSSNGIRYSSFSRTKSRKAFTLSFLDISLLSWKRLVLPLAVTSDFKVSSMKVESISSIRVVC